MPAGHQQFFEQQGWTPEYFLAQATQIGTSVHQYVGSVLKSRAYTEQTYNACRGSGVPSVTSTLPVFVLAG